MLNAIVSKISEIKPELAYKAALRKHQPKLPTLSQSDRLVVDTLKREGVYVTSLQELGFDSTSYLLQAAETQLSRMNAVNNSNTLERLPQIYTVTDLPEFSRWAREQRLLNIIENYIGLPVAFQGVHLRKDFPNVQQFGTLLWHRDSEDRRVVKIFVYLTDVEEKHGPFEYVPLSLTSLYTWNYYRTYYKLWRSGYIGITDDQLKEIIPQKYWKSCTGPAGTVIISDAGATLHHGTLRTQDRSALFFVYTANSPKRPELCTQYWDDTFARPKVQQEALNS